MWQKLLKILKTKTKQQAAKLSENWKLVREKHTEKKKESNKEAKKIDFLSAVFEPHNSHYTTWQFLPCLAPTQETIFVFFFFNIKKKKL